MAMTPRERFLAILNYQLPDEPYFLFMMGLAGGLQKRWEREGLPKDTNIEEFFGLERLAWVPVSVWPYPGRADIIIEKGDTYRIVRDNRDLITRYDDSAGDFPHYIGYPIKTRDDWEKYKVRVNRGCEERYDWLRQGAETLKRSNLPVTIGLRGCWEVHYFAGMTEVMCMMHDDPEFVEEMLEFWFGHQWEIIDRICQYVTPDAAFIWEDLAYKNGPFVSPAMYNKFFAKYHRQTADRLKAHGVHHLIVDCDGKIDDLLPLFLDNGITGTFPLECQAEADPVKFRKRFGKRVQLVGGIDKRTLITGRDAIRKEVDYKLTNLVADSGFMPGPDHAVPPEVSYDNFRFFMDYTRETWAKLLRG